MKKIIFLLVIISVAASGQQHSESLQGKIILMFKNNTSLSDSFKVDVQYKTGNYKIDEINLLHQSISVTKQQLGQKTNKFIYIIQFTASTNLKPIIDAYYETGEIEYAEPDYVGTIGGVQEVVPNDQYYFRQWGLHNDGTFPPGLAVAGADLDMQNAWEIEQGDRSIIVGILDTGVKFDHPELAGRTWINYNEIPNNLIDDDANGYIDDVKGWNFAGSNNNPVDGHGHGTNISGIVGANSNNTIGYSGVDWNCKLMTLKGFTDVGGGNVSWWANAIYYAVDNGARVVNMSFGITNNSITLEDAVNYALENNVVLVACMMNDNSNTVYYPAAYTGVIAVGSTDWDDTRSQPFPWNPNSGSNWGDHISVVAPGNVIFGLDYLSNTNYEVFFSGTSQATANVSGVAALLLAQDSERTPGDIKYIIEATAEDTIGDPIEDIPGWDPYYGFGRVNAYYALLSSQPCLPEGITLTTQAEIDNFQTNYPGCTEVEGDVIISGSDITNLNGLNTLTSIEGTLRIGFDGWGNGMLTNLAGLENLTTIGGSLIIGGHNYGGWMPWNPVLSSLNGLDNLISIGGNLTIYYNPELSDLTGLYGITSIQGNLTINENYSLTNCSIQNICDYLNTPSGIVEIYKNGPGCNSQSEVVAGCGGSIPCLPYGNYYFISQADIDNFQVNFPGCNELAGNLTINGNSITNLTGLNPVISIAGHAMIQACLNLTSLSGLNNLLTVGGSLQLMYNSSLINLTGFENLHSVGGLRLCENYQLSDLSGLENLDSIEGWLAIGTIFTGVPNPPPGGNYMLVSISSLANLTYVGGGINIGRNNSLPSLAGLENINANTVTDILIGNNNSLTTCDVQSICDYLISPNGTLTISNNAPGCNSQEEVEEHCLTKVEEIKTGNELTIIPNPSKDKITISSPALKGDTQLLIFNVSGEKILERHLTDTETQLDISALPRGVYFARVQDEERVEVTKIIKE